jgi:hypothetical protein
MAVAAIVAALLAWAGAVVAPGAFGDETPALMAVQDLSHVFALSVPTTWQTKVMKGDTAVSAASPAVDGLSDTVEVVVRDTMVGITDPKSCEEKAEWVMRVWLHKQFTTISTGPTNIGGMPSYAMTYTWTAPNGTERWSTQACLVRSRKVYVLTGTTTNIPVKAPARAALIMQILNSFHFTVSASQ